MAKQPAKNVNISIATVAVEDDVDNFSLNVQQEIPTVTSFADAGPRRVVGNYDYSLEMSGAVDFASGQTDATFFALVGDADGGAVAVDPTGASAAANDPNYDSTSMVLESYRISGQVGGRVDFAATMQGAAALVRNVS